MKINRATGRIQGCQALLKMRIYYLRRVSILDRMYRASHTFLGYCQVSVLVSSRSLACEKGRHEKNVVALEDRLAFPRGRFHIPTRSLNADLRRKNPVIST